MGGNLLSPLALYSGRGVGGEGFGAWRDGFKPLTPNPLTGVRCLFLLPPPSWGRVGVGGRTRGDRLVFCGAREFSVAVTRPPHPNPPPRGGGGKSSLFRSTYPCEPPTPLPEYRARGEI